jgi:CIC family chloride channel protein
MPRRGQLKLVGQKNLTTEPLSVRLTHGREDQSIIPAQRGAPRPVSVGRGHLFMVAVAIVCGLGGGFGAVILQALIEFVQGMFFGQGADFLSLVDRIPWIWRLLAPAFGGLVVGPLVYFFAQEAKGHGVPEVMESIVVHGGVIRPRVVVVKALASAITIGSGGSVGEEGISHSLS